MRQLWAFWVLWLVDQEAAMESLTRRIMDQCCPEWEWMAAMATELAELELS